MPTEQQDTEITLGTGRMLAIFFAFVLVCAFFFAIGFSLGRKTTMAVAGSLLSAPSATPATVVRPSPAKNDGSQTPQSSSSDFGFYKAVGEKKADTALPQDSKMAATTAAPTAGAPANAAADAATAAAPSMTSSYYVQVAAVTRQEDADALVEALQKKQYPAFTVPNTSTDKFYRVQVGPYADFREADAVRARLISDGYNPIVKK
jgi:cell division septation protein DedD